MTSLVVIQARMASTRLPGKVLRVIADRPALRLQIERLRAGGIEPVVATSDGAADDAVAALCAGIEVECVRGSEQDVLARFALAASRHPDAELVVRLTADCPLTDPAVVRHAIDVATQTGADYTSNSLQRTFPDGFDVEVLRVDALREAAASATDRAEREHVTPFVVRRPSRFRLASIDSGRRFGHLRLTLDTAADLEVIRSVAARLDDPATSPWAEAVALLPPSAAPAAVPRGVEGPLALRHFELVGDRTVGLEVLDVGTGVLRADGTITVPELRAVLGWLAMDAQVTGLSVGSLRV